MSKALLLSLACVVCFGGMTEVIRAEEKVEIKTKKDGSWKMKVHRKDDKWVGTYGEKTYYLRGDGAAFKDEGEYTVYGDIAPDDTYITTTRYERVEPAVRVDPAVRVEVGREDRDREWARMHVTRNGDNWVGVHEGKTYQLSGEQVKGFKSDGDYTIRGRVGTDGTSITTSHSEYHERK